MRPFPSKAPTASLPPLPIRLLPGGANQFPGGSCTRWSPAPFTAHFNANYRAPCLGLRVNPEVYLPPGVALHCFISLNRAKWLSFAP